jgi:autotransporter-associated beta strand protein
MSRCAILPRVHQFVIAATLLLTIGTRLHGQTTLTWTGAGSNSNWSNVNNWGGVNYPNNGQPTAGATYNATINSGSQTLDTAVTINNLTYATGGTLTGSGSSTLTVNGLLTWSAGTFTLNQLTLGGGASITGSSEAFAATITNSNGSVATLSNEGGNLVANSAAAIWVNQSGATVTLSADANLTGSSGQFTNNSGATFQKTGGAGTSAVAWAFTNSGTVSNTSGILQFNAAVTQSGSITIGGGATVQLNGSTSTWGSGGGTSGAGTLLMSNGTQSFNSTNTLASAVSLTNGVIDGTGAMTISGPFTWSGGNLGASSSPGAGTTTLSGGGTISNSPTLNRAVINANGSAVQLTGTGSILTNGNASWTNQSGSSFTFTSDGALAGAGTFTNAAGAIFQKTGGTNQSSVNFAFTNNGTINATSGTLQFSTTFVQNGAITVGSGANVLFNNNNTTWTWAGTGSSSGTGTVTFNSETTIFNGTNTLASAVSFSGGAFDGSGTLTISGPLTWGGGASMGATSSPGAGTTILSGGASITGGVSINRAVTNASGSNVQLTGGGMSFLANGSWTNQTGSTFTFASDNSISNGGASGAFINAVGATVQKTIGTSTSNIAVPFTNNGAFSVTSGTLAINGTTDTQNGTITIAANATATFNGGTSTWTGTASASGAGTLLLNNGATMLFNGTNAISAPFTFQSGTIDGTGTMAVSNFFFWTGGNLGANSSPGAGITTLSGGATIGFVNLNRSVTNASGSAVQLYGNITAQGANAVWTNQSGSSFSWGNDGTLGNGMGTFNNQAGAILQKISGGGTSEVTWSFTNAGTVNAASGTLRFDILPNLVSGTLNAGTWNVSAGATLLFIPGNVTTIGANAAVSLAGAGSTFAALDTHLATNAGSLSILSGRAFTPNGTLTNTGTLIVGQTAADGSQFTGSVTTGSGGTLRGTGAITGTATLGNGSTLAPGTVANPGSLAAGAWTFQTSGTYLLKYNPATTSPVAGTDNDAITSSAGTLNLSGLSAGNQFTFKLQPDSSATPVVNPVTFVAGSFTSAIMLPAGVTSANLSTIFNFTGNYSGTPTASLDATLEKLQITFVPVAASSPGALTWTGSSTGNWSNNGNWNPANAPASSVNNQLTFGATSNAAMTNDIAGTLVLNSLNFTASSPTYSLSGNGLNFQTNSSSVPPQIVTNSANGVSIGNAITLTNNLTVGGSGRVILSGTVGGTGGLTYSGTGMLTLTGTNTYSGGTTIANGTLGIASDLALGSGALTLGSFGALEFTATTTTPKSYSLNGGTLAVASGQTVTLNGSQISGGYVSGPGTFATSAANGAHFGNLTTRPSATLTSNSGADSFLNISNGGTLNVAANLPAATPVTLVGFTNQGSGTITIGAASSLDASDFQTYGMLSISPATITETFSQTTLLTNAGTSQLYFNGGSQTFVGTPATAVFPPTWPDQSLRGLPTFVAGIDLNGKNATVAGGLFVNNGYVEDTTNNGQGTATVVADFGSLVKGAGYFQNTVQTVNGGKFQAGNSPGKASFGSFVLGRGGVNNYVFAIDDATGTAGPSPDAAGRVSGWGLVKAINQLVGGASTAPGNFTWTATPTEKLTVSLETLVNPTTVGDDVPGTMADFDPSRAYTWPAIEWAGAYTGPAEVAYLNASTSFDTSGFANPVAGTFGWALDTADNTLSLTYTPSAVPEPSALVLSGIAGAVAVFRPRRRQAGIARGP